MAVLPDNIAPPELARITVEVFVADGRVVDPPADPQEPLRDPAGAFVTLRTIEEGLRGCIGTISPTRPTLAEEIIQNAISAAIRDPRFEPVTVDELPLLIYSVDVLRPPERVRGPEDLDPSRYGVIIETLDQTRRGLLLPAIEGIETVDQQWRAVHLKAGIKSGTAIRVERFEVRRFDQC